MTAQRGEGWVARPVLAGLIRLLVVIVPAVAGALASWEVSRLEDKTRRTFQWPLAKQRRQHIHSRIDAAELPVTHVTRRQGRPYTLVLNKTDALFAREQEARARDQADLEWLATE